MFSNYQYWVFKLSEKFETTSFLKETSTGFSIVRIFQARKENNFLDVYELMDLQFVKFSKQSEDVVS